MVATLTGYSAFSKLFFCKSQGFNSGHNNNNDPQICFFTLQRIASSSCAKFPKLLSLQRNPILLVSSLSSSSDSQVELQPAEIQLPDQGAAELETVHVRLQLQKVCQFGEQFLVVGNDPILGLWNPLDAIPMAWSDGHVWTTELDVPIGKSIEFKFILRQITGNFLWQPGPDRTLRTWETKNTISVLGDWENADSQQVTEVENVQNQYEELTGSSEVLIAADNLSQPTKAAITDISKPIIHIDGREIDETEKPEVEIAEDPAAGHFINSSNDEAMVADNITYMSTDVSSPMPFRLSDESERELKPMQNIVYSGEESCSNEEIGEKAIAVVEKGPASSPNDGVMTAKDTVEGNWKDARDQSLQSTVVDESLKSYEGVPSLVPGLTTCSDMPTEEAIPNQTRHSLYPSIEEVTPEDEIVDAFVKDSDDVPDDLCKFEMKESEKEEKDEGKDYPQEEETTEVMSIDMIQGNEGSTEAMIKDRQKLVDEPAEHNTHSTKDEYLTDSDSADDSILQKDAKWGEKTLKKLLSNLGRLL
ncbi:hypothetical protein Ancab_032226 [Ancistrocladus abbreviatus]